MFLTFLKNHISDSGISWFFLNYLPILDKQTAIELRGDLSLLELIYICTDGILLKQGILIWSTGQTVWVVYFMTVPFREPYELRRALHHYWVSGELFMARGYFLRHKNRENSSNLVLQMDWGLNVFVQRYLYCCQWPQGNILYTVYDVWHISHIFFLILLSSEISVTLLILPP